MPKVPSVARRHRSRLCAGLIFAGAAVVVSAPVGARAGDLFSELPGNWVGSGTVIKSDATTETLRCKVKYTLAPSGTIVHQELRCAADSYRMNFVTDLINDKGELAGTWKEVDRQAGGAVSGRIDGNVISTKITGTAFEAAVVITTKGDKQTILLTSNSGNYAKSVNIALKAE